MNRVVVDGVGLEVVYEPRVGAPTLVFLHEGLGSVSQWRDFPARVAEAAECGLLVYSRQGYGRSNPVPLPRPLTYMHDEGKRVLPALFDALGVGDAFLFGHSDGGSIALIAAGSGVASVRGLVLEAPHVFCEDISVEAIARAKEAYETTELRDKLRRHHGDNVDCAFWGWNGAWLDPDFRHWNIEEFLPGVEVPVLVIQGREDPYGTLAQVDAIAGGVRGPCEQAILDGCGHAPHKEQPESRARADRALPRDPSPLTRDP